MSWGPIELQVLIGALRSACEEMGGVLIRSAYSANIKERRDCSTAIFDAAGELVMQAEHIPVHLGSMPEAVAAVIDHDHRPGDSWILNDPFRGGTHLPDITLISPIFSGSTRLGFAASRAHHADVGGDTPGSMPAHSRRLEEEGVVIEPSRVSPELIESLVGRMRDPDQRRADLRAQAAANRIGATRLGELAERHGIEGLRSGMDAILGYSERRARAIFTAIGDGSSQAEERLENDPAGGDQARRDLHLRVRAELHGDELTLDFDGTDGPAEGNLNCPEAVTRSAALFAVRALTDPDAPPSAGAHRPITIRVPAGCLLSARAPAAVAAGNVETSSRVADLVIEALAGLMPAPAQGQGTMNNLTLAAADSGPDQWTYYETLGGGQGGGPDGPGPDAVHVAMSNTLNTPVEALESEFPLRIRELSLRRGSGGKGRHKGGDGIIREIEALAPVRFSLITERRRLAPRGRDGGSDGKPGRNQLNGVDLPAKTEGLMKPGDVLRIETPGGGGFG